MMNWKAALWLFVLPLLHGQSISFAPQGAAALKALTGKRIKGVQIVSVIACPATISLPWIGAGEIYYESIRRGYDPILPSFAAAVVNDAVQHNKKWYVLEGMRILSIAALDIGTEGISATWRRVLAGAHGIGDELSPRIQERLPNPTPLLVALLDPAGRLDITQSCQVGAILAVYPKRKV